MMKVETELNKLNGRIIKLLDSMRAYEMEQLRLDIERKRLKLARDRAIGAFDVDVDEDPAAEIGADDGPDLAGE